MRQSFFAQSFFTAIFLRGKINGAAQAAPKLAQ
jgi:hypothetical protein